MWLHNATSRYFLSTAKDCQNTDKLLQGLRHGLIDGFYSVAHGKFVYNILSNLIKVDLPGIISSCRGQLHHSLSFNVCHKVKKILQKKRGRKRLSDVLCYRNDCVLFAFKLTVNILDMIYVRIRS